MGAWLVADWHWLTIVACTGFVMVLAVLTALVMLGVSMVRESRSARKAFRRNRANWGRRQ
jgi:hypothetical protein